MDMNVMLLGALGTASSREDQFRNWEHNAAAFAEMVDGLNWLGKLIGVIARVLAYRPQVSRPAHA